MAPPAPRCRIAGGPLRNGWWRAGRGRSGNEFRGLEGRSRTAASQYGRALFTSIAVRRRQPKTWPATILLRRRDSSVPQLDVTVPQAVFGCASYEINVSSFGGRLDITMPAPSAGGTCCQWPGASESAQWVAGQDQTHATGTSPRLWIGASAADWTLQCRSPAGRWC